MRALSKDLSEFIHLLNQEGVNYLIVGAWAVGFHGRPRYTGDIDIFLRRDSENAERMMRVIQLFGFANVGLTREDFLKTDFIVQLGVEPNRIDILTGISGVDFALAWEHRVSGSLGGLQVSFISRDLLLQNKRAANRAKDIGDIEILEGTRPKPSK